MSILCLFAAKMKKIIFPFKAKRKPREKPPCHSFRGEREEKGKRGNVFKTQAIGACYAHLVSPPDTFLCYGTLLPLLSLCSFQSAFSSEPHSPSPFSKAKSNSRQMAPTPPLPLPFPPPLQCLPPTPPLLPGPGGIAPQPHFKVLFPPTAAAAAWLACNSHTERAIVGKGTDGGGGGRKRGS